MQTQSPSLPVTPSPPRNRSRTVGTFGILLATLTSLAMADGIAVQAVRPANWRSMRLPVEAVRPLPPAADLVALLDSPRYAERERATHLLTLHGAEAVPLLEQAARSDSPEVAIRGINALEGLWARAIERQDLAALESAIEALDKLSIAKDPVLSERVAAIFAARQEMIHEYSLNQVRRLGGTIRRNEHIRSINNDGTLRESIECVIVGRDWTGGVEGLRHVRRLFPRGGIVYFINGGDLPENIATQFESISPGIRAAPRGASQLGVAGSSPQAAGIAGCLVGRVEPGSAAAQAGMQMGDVIEKFNGAEIKSFENLVDEIAKIEPETTVPATVRRGENRLEMKVTLQGWE